MKLWWVHNEAMVAMLMAFVETKDTVYWQRFIEARGRCISSLMQKPNSYLIHTGSRVGVETLC
jgi:hypothetical protein